MSPACTAANYVKVHAFLARGTCLFSPPRRLVLFYSCRYSLSFFFSTSFSAILLFASFIFHSCRPYHSLEVARIISPVEYHIRPRLRARSFGSTKRDIIAMRHYRSEREISYLSPCAVPQWENSHNNNLRFRASFRFVIIGALAARNLFIAHYYIWREISWCIQQVQIGCDVFLIPISRYFKYETSRSLFRISNKYRNREIYLSALEYSLSCMNLLQPPVVGIKVSGVWFAVARKSRLRVA